MSAILLMTMDLLNFPKYFTGQQWNITMNIPTNSDVVPAADFAATMPPGPLSSGGGWLDPAKLHPANPAENVASQRSKFDPARFRLDQSFAAGATNKKSTITAHKPDPHNWFMAHPDPAFHFPN